MKAWSAALLITGMLVAVPGRPAQAQGRSHIGAHVGYNFDVEKALIGAQLLLPIGRRVELYPSFDYYFVDPGSLIGISGDVKFRFPTGGESVFYAGGGVNWLRASGGAVIPGGISCSASNHDWAIPIRTSKVVSSITTVPHFKSRLG